MSKDKLEKVTQPLMISSFNRHMCWSTLYILLLIFLLKTTINLPNWLILIMQITCWINIVCGIILCIGYAVAIAEQNVIILAVKDDKIEKR